MTPPEDIGAHPVVIIGAGRSGTNMLRDVLAGLPEVATWPCDEINYIWRYGNKYSDTDELTAKDVSARIKRYIRGRFRTFVRSSKLLDTPMELRIVLEKTCANSLRVDFVDEIFPEARYLYLVRDGRDVSVSAAKRWTAPLDIGYLYAKAKYVPFADLPFYAFNYLVNRVKKLGSSEARLKIWGPRFVGWRDSTVNLDLHTLCALQWAKCIEKSDNAFESISSHRIIKVHYESLISDPIAEIRKIIEFLNLECSQEEIRHACKIVNRSSLTRDPTNLSFDASVQGFIEEKLLTHGYPVDA